MSHDVNRQAQRERERESRLKEPAGRTEVHDKMPPDKMPPTVEFVFIFIYLIFFL